MRSKIAPSRPWPAERVASSESRVASGNQAPAPGRWERGLFVCPLLAPVPQSRVASPRHSPLVTRHAIISGVTRLRLARRPALGSATVPPGRRDEADLGLQPEGDRG